MLRALFLAALLLPGTAGAQAFSFGLFADFPYSHYERQLLPDLLGEMDAENLAFVAHLGDIKDGSSACSDRVLRDRFDAFQTSRHPFILVPGDNEWTDCRRSGFDPLERLAALRAVFYPDAHSLGQRRLRLERQSEHAAFAAYRENARWRVGPVLFVALNLPGSRNNVGTGLQRNAEYVERNRANRAWLGQAFDQARRERLAAVVVLIHGNPGFEAYARGNAQRPYQAFLDQLVAETRRFGRQVLLAHGDTHSHRIDQPLRHTQGVAPLANLMRVETYGSPFLGWVKVTVSPGAHQPLRIESRPWGRRARP